MSSSKESTQLVWDIRYALVKTGRILLDRNNSGVIKTRTETNENRRYKYGLGKGSGDLVGCVRMRSFLPHIQSSYTGSAIIGRHIEIEVKYGSGRPSTAQLARATAVRAFGGYYGVARSVEEALEHLEKAANGEP